MSLDASNLMIEPTRGSGITSIPEATPTNDQLIQLQQEIDKKWKKIDTKHSDTSQVNK